MKKTGRLGLPNVEKDDFFNVNLWNDGYDIIDQKCLAFKVSETITITPNQQEFIQDFTDTTPYHFLEILPDDTTNSEEWNAIALASFRVWLAEKITETGEIIQQIHFYCEGIVPTIAVNVKILGWY